MSNENNIFKRYFKSTGSVDTEFECWVWRLRRAGPSSVLRLSTIRCWNIVTTLYYLRRGNIVSKSTKTYVFGSKNIKTIEITYKFGICSKLAEIISGKIIGIRGSNRPHSQNVQFTNTLTLSISYDISCNAAAGTPLRTYTYSTNVSVFATICIIYVPHGNFSCKQCSFGCAMEIIKNLI